MCSPGGGGSVLKKSPSHLGENCLIISFKCQKATWSTKAYALHYVNVNNNPSECCILVMWPRTASLFTSKRFKYLKYRTICNKIAEHTKRQHGLFSAIIWDVFTFGLVSQKWHMHFWERPIYELLNHPCQSIYARNYSYSLIRTMFIQAHSDSKCHCLLKMSISI